MTPVIVLLLLLLLLGGGGFAYNALWYVLIVGLVLWVIGFVARSSASGRRGRWYYW